MKVLLRNDFATAHVDFTLMRMRKLLPHIATSNQSCAKHARGVLLCY